jgi:hypothetical protein
MPDGKRGKGALDRARCAQQMTDAALAGGHIGRGLPFHQPTQKYTVRKPSSIKLTGGIFSFFYDGLPLHQPTQEYTVRKHRA